MCMQATVLCGFESVLMKCQRGECAMQGLKTKRQQNWPPAVGPELYVKQQKAKGDFLYQI